MALRFNRRWGPPRMGYHVRPARSTVELQSAFEVGSTLRASTSRFETSSRVASKPNCVHASVRTFQSTREREPVSVGAVVAAGVSMNASSRAAP